MCVCVCVRVCVSVCVCVYVCVCVREGGCLCYEGNEGSYGQEMNCLQGNVDNAFFTCCMGNCEMSTAVDWGWFGIRDIYLLII